MTATRHDLETVLSFVGEQVVSASSANWHSTITEAVSKPQQVCLALINDCQQLDTLQLLKDLHDWEPGLPFVLIGEQQLPEQLDADLQSRITATLPEALTHQPSAGRHSQVQTLSRTLQPLTRLWRGSRLQHVSQPGRAQ
jgi:hypothetical protein